MRDTAGAANEDDPTSQLAETVGLRILATTDMHMKLLPHDYLADRPCRQGSLAQIASLVDRRRAGRNTLLLDNGDFLQGTPLGDQAAQAGGRHPAIAAMNRMGYDAAAIGNHDFAFGLDVLQAAARQARFPFLAANLRLRGRPDFPRFTILDKRVLTDGGRPASLRIGLVGFLPPQTTAWDRDLSRQMACDDILATARLVVPQMKEAGADLIIALAHSGISHRPAAPFAENVAAELAVLDGVDVIVAGHTHEVFPGQHMEARPGVDAAGGTLSGKPAVMPGFAGSHLGVIDLSLARGPGANWRLSDAKSRCEAIGPDLPPAPAIMGVVSPAHRKTMAGLRVHIGRSDRRISSYFALVGVDPALSLVNMAQRWFVRKSLAGTRLDDVPVLSAAAPFRAGGRGGPGHYTDVAPGRLRLGNLTDIYSFPNRICALQIDGADLRNWLERSASLFRQIRPGDHDQPLTDPGFPAYQFDVIQDVAWRIDLSAPPAFSVDGFPTGGSRIRDLTWRGRPVRDDDRFILATNSYRLAACGLFAPLTTGKPSPLPPGPPTRNVIRDYLRQRRCLSIDPRPAWQFSPMSDTTVLFETGPQGLPLLAEVADRCGRRMEHVGRNDRDFAVIRLHL
ncbi:bifunctional 2',3'-cyclic-nucleotide 2'-phosphodiesterase/3'-nucleotidase [Paracoccus sp. WLY502]|uniref:bifunctional 2',3'-cyclic-nucleotide 2'-phosphodiesterase/3'-nucleotidase n=1 Tax=Paracoccus yibinensis TaxID=3068891 RepID=UPI002796861F|nr:bifunctional 2',3'-cyclic-nucleotide 2'-phosphodiesterase/3'-nucleotidase [Paracoccus sp. WLY502]MDQ1899652.1 bifunctional 2',3'-cyclic-nucleotide 2'-phosphodiesterase/3'-nucleotidase [Paracoccus sp. WLY502]